MKKAIALILIFVSFVTYSQTDSIRLKELESKINALNDSINIIKQDEASLYSLKRDIIQTKSDTFVLRKEFKEEHEGLFAEFLTHWVTWLTTMLLAIISIFGYRKFISDYVKRIEKEVQTRVKTEVDEIIPRKVSEITQVKINILKKEYRQFEKHTKYREEAKILIINEGTKVPKGFDKVMDLFKDADGSEIDRLTISDLSDLKKHYQTFTNYELLVIENHIVKNWIIDNRYESHELKELKIKKKMVLESDLNNEDRSKQISILEKEIESEKNRINGLATKNNKNLSDLADNICHETAIIYKGLGQFPINDVKDDYVHMVTFANAFSQLYGNILSMLKFINELK